MIKAGRPRLDSHPDFIRRFARVLPALSVGAISKGEASKRLGISHRSLNRYLKQLEQQEFRRAYQANGHGQRRHRPNGITVTPFKLARRLRRILTVRPRTQV